MGAGSLMKITKPVLKITRNGIRFLSKNSNVILTVLSATGMIGTVAVAIKGTIKAVKLCEEKKVTDGKEIIRTVWKCYIPTIGMVILTTTAILCNGRINAKRIAVLTSAYSGSVEAIKKLEEKMSEQIGPKKTQRAIDEAEGAMAQAQVPKSKNDVIATGNGTQLFFCASTGQWFYSDWNGVELAEKRFQASVAKTIRNWGSCMDFIKVSEAQEALGLRETDMGTYMGWPVEDLVKMNNPEEGIKFVICSEWMDLPWGREVVGIVRFTPWPDNI